MKFQLAGGRLSSCGCRICEASAGDNVSEQKQEIAVATAMVTANCWKNCPEMPPRNAVGTNTAHSTSPNRVRLLIENPSAAITAKVPTSETGIAMIGMIAGRQPCKNTSTTMTTSSIAS